MYTTIDKSKIFGVDLSYYEGAFNLPQALASGVDFVSIRVGQGLSIDPQFHNSWSECKGRVPRNGYWLFDPRYSVNDQVQLCLQALAGDYGEIDFTLDAEYPFKGCTDKEYDSFMNAGAVPLYGFVHGIEQASGKSMMVYSNQSFIARIFALQQTVTREWWAMRYLWIADPDVSQPAIPDPWTTWEFWQFTWNADGKSLGTETLGVDCNYFNGDYARFRMMFPAIGGSIPTPSPVPSPTPALTVDSIDHIDITYKSGKVVTIR